MVAGTGAELSLMLAMLMITASRTDGRFECHLLPSAVYHTACTHTLCYILPLDTVLHQALGRNPFAQLLLLSWPLDDQTR